MSHPIKPGSLLGQPKEFASPKRRRSQNGLLSRGITLPTFDVIDTAATNDAAKVNDWYTKLSRGTVKLIDRLDDFSRPRGADSRACPPNSLHACRSR